MKPAADGTIRDDGAGGEKAGTMTTRRLAYWWLRFVFSGRFLGTFLGGRGRRSPIGRSARHPRIAERISDAVGGTAISRSAACKRPRCLERIAALPGQIGQAAGKRLMAAQPARAQHMPDLVGKAADLGFDQVAIASMMACSRLPQSDSSNSVDADLQWHIRCRRCRSGCSWPITTRLFFSAIRSASRLSSSWSSTIETAMA